jgi:hypothetical protein
LFRLQGIPLKIYKETLYKRDSYQNGKDTYNFDDFNVKVSFDTDRVRTITVNSPDIEVKLWGNFNLANSGI